MTKYKWQIELATSGCLYLLVFLFISHFTLYGEMLAFPFRDLEERWGETSGKTRYQFAKRQLDHGRRHISLARHSISMWMSTSHRRLFKSCFEVRYLFAKDSHMTFKDTKAKLPRIHCASRNMINQAVSWHLRRWIAVQWRQFVTEGSYNQAWISHK